MRYSKLKNMTYMEEEKNKYQLVIDSCINGNWAYNKKKIKYWKKGDKSELLEMVKEIYPEGYSDFINIVVLGD